ncbi:efflux RND transporter periplasmic adaptor subunit [Rhodovarius lipocyclicus]|uniref:efflux RND transporter periplasmic adaptor subunit n=1 Tax=Rhodovarius lipocyclicus TaxID=268410 RepID=UPI0013569449|nr:efflux RND transporter periplasmic adaptor subunit [Rhodovarius lipocyclicus]
MDVIDPPAVPAKPQAKAAEHQDKMTPAPVRAGRPWLWLLLLGTALAGVGAGVMVLNEHAEATRNTPSLATAPAPSAPGEFRLSEAEMRALRIEPVASRSFRAERVAEGRISVNEDRSTPVLAPFTGRVTRAFVRLGDSVAAGAPLFEVETPDVTSAANDLLSGLDNVRKAETALAQARREDQRQQSLFGARAASQRDVEQARAALRSAESDLHIAESAQAAARDRLRVLGRDAQAIAEIERTRQVSGIVTVTAPFAGTITQRRLSPGMWLTSGQGDPVLTISDLSSKWLVAAVREMDVPLIRDGLPLEVSVGALPGRTFEARITRTGAGLDPTTRRMTVQAEVRDEQNLLRPEMFATFRIEVGEARDNPAVPVSAIVYRGAEANVWVAMDGGRFIMRRITTGNRSGDLLEVTEGLSAGDRIVTGGVLFIDRAARID